MKFTSIALIATVVFPLASALRGEADNDLQPYLHHDIRDLRSGNNGGGGMKKNGGMMKGMKGGGMKGGKKGPKGTGDDLYEGPVDLEEFPQWATEEGYWYVVAWYWCCVRIGEHSRSSLGDSEDFTLTSLTLTYFRHHPTQHRLGDYTFYQGDGSPFVSSSWNYPYNSYKGFITGAIQGPAYRQRNVFLYPPQTTSVCETRNDVIGQGTCGANGNAKVFSADQVAADDDTDGSISGPYLGIFETTTELIGRDNALLYQVYLGDDLFQSQLTTITVDGATGDTRRTRSAQSYQAGVPRAMSFYRERKVSKAEFYEALEQALEEYNLLESDTCAWMDSSAGFGLVNTEYTPGFGGCVEHLEQSFECFFDC